MSRTARGNTRYRMVYARKADNGRTYWHKIGYATDTTTQGGERMIRCMLLSTPLNWDGSFALFEDTYEAEQKEES